MPPQVAALEERFIRISPRMLVPGQPSGFSVHIMVDGALTSFTGQGEIITNAHLDALEKVNVTDLFIPYEHNIHYQGYLEEHLPCALTCEKTPIAERAKLLHETAETIIRDAYEQRLPDHIVSNDEYQRLVDLIRTALRSLAEKDCFKAVSQIISSDYRTFSHCLHVFLYSTAILQSYNLPEDDLVDAGIGAVLHDIGKACIPQEIIRKTGALTLRERAIINTHPTAGLDMVAALPLPVAARECILLHHEKLDGSGYPGRIRGDHIPLHVRAVTIADIYDAMTSNRPYSRSMNPFRVLRVMRDEMFHEIDINVFTRFVKVLSGAHAI